MIKEEDEDDNEGDDVKPTQEGDGLSELGGFAGLTGEGAWSRSRLYVPVIFFLRALISRVFPENARNSVRRKGSTLDWAS